MIEQFVPYELALKLKELGFKDECLGSYYHAGRKLDIYEYINHGEYTVLAPLWQQAFDWFRQKHNIHSEIRSYTAYKFTFVIQKLENVVEYIEYGGIKTSYKTYEEARLECLKKLIKTVEDGITL